MYEEFLKNFFVKYILSLDLPADDFVLAGSAASFVHGIVHRQMDDLDIVAEGAAWTELREHGILLHNEAGSPYKGPYLKFKGLNLEAFQYWIDEEAQSVISQARTITFLYHGKERTLHIFPVAKVKEYKERLGRPKDRADLEAINNCLRSYPDTIKW